MQLSFLPSSPLLCRLKTTKEESDSVTIPGSWTLATPGRSVTRLRWLSSVPGLWPAAKNHSSCPRSPVSSELLPLSCDFSFSTLEANLDRFTTTPSSRKGALGEPSRGRRRTSGVPGGGGGGAITTTLPFHANLCNTALKQNPQRTPTPPFSLSPCSLSSETEARTQLWR
jgi:hypothetical protein